MEHKGKFNKVKKSNKPMYGPRALLVCGYLEEEQSVFLGLIEKTGLDGVRVIFATTRDLTKTVGDILSNENFEGSTATSDMSRAVVMSGLTQKELHNLMGTYRKTGFTPQIWAALTPVSEKWPLETLLDHLVEEKKAMEQNQDRK